MAVLNEYTDIPPISSYTENYDDDTGDDIVIQGQLPSPEPELLDSVPAKKQTLQIVSKSPVVSVGQIPDFRLPHPCPLPNTFSVETLEAEGKGEMVGCNKFRMLREACSFYRGICLNPTPSEYTIMAQTLCERFPQIKDKLSTDGKYWVSNILNSYCLFIMKPLM